jgi:hypothetical protein
MITSLVTPLLVPLSESAAKADAPVESGIVMVAADGSTMVAADGSPMIP